ncbi:MAG: tetratricopeptide repeat protein [Bacilli bacterium]
MLKIIITDDIKIFQSDKVIKLTQKKLKAIIAFFVIEESIERTVLAEMFFNGNKNPIRNSIYMINKIIGTDFLVNQNRNIITLNTKIKYEVEIDKTNFLADLKFSNESFFRWKQQQLKKDFYVNQQVLDTVYFDFLKTNSSNYLINGQNGVGKTEFVSRLYDLIPDNKIRVKCTKHEQYFSLNIIHIILNYLSKFEKKNFLTIFTDINYNDKKAFLDENNLLNLYYLPITELLIKILSEELSKKYLIIIEDIEYIDSTSLSLINKLIEFKNLNLVFIMTYNTSKKPNVNISKDVKKFTIADWNKDDVKKYIEYYYPNHINYLNEIFEFTNGNPFYIEVVMNNLIASNTLSLSRDYLANTFKCLNESEKDILKYISCFNGSSSLKSICKIFLIDKQVIYKLSQLNILKIRSVNNKDKVYFKHSILKDYIYVNLEEEQRFQFHLMIAQEIERNLKLDSLIKVYEIYFHYSKANNLVKMTQYKIKYLSLVSSYTHSVFPHTDKFNFITSNQHSSYNIKNEVKELEEIFKTNVILRTNNEILIDFYTLKNRYDIIVGETKGVKNNILNHIKLCNDISNKSELIKAYYIMIYYGLNIGNHEIIDKYLIMLNNLIDTKSNAITRRIKGYTYILKHEYNKSIFTLNESLELSNNLSKELAETNLVACYAYLGEVHIITHNYKRALKDLKRGEKIVNESSNYISGSILIKLFMAICYFRLNDNKHALEYIREAYQTYDNSDLCWKRCSCYLYARQIYKCCNLDYKIFDDKINKCKIKYHSDLGKWLYNEFLKETNST